MLNMEVFRQNKSSTNKLINFNTEINLVVVYMKNFTQK